VDGSGGEQAAVGIATANLGAVRDDYALETCRLIRRRFGLTVILFLGFVGLAVYAEWSSHPERVHTLRLIYALEFAACLAGLVAAYLPSLRRQVPVIAGATACALAFLLSAYITSVGQTIETLAIAQVCLMTSVAVLLPWGLRVQFAVCSATVGSFVLAQAWGHGSTEPYPLIAVVTGATTSIWAAFFLDRYRYEAFVRAAELARASVINQEEAAVSNALAHVGATLSAGMGRRDLFESVNRLTLDLLACDWSSTFVFDEQRGVFRYCANVGSRAEVVSELGSIEFPRQGLPLFAEFRQGELVEIPDATATPLVPSDFARRWDVASALYVPIWRGAQLLGVLASGYRDRRGAFSNRQRRLALGIGNATAIALENERLVGDLQAANSLKSEFVSTMSHELRTPLNVITGYAEMLRDEETGTLTPQQGDLLHRIERNAETLLDLINSTLDLGRLEAGRDPITVEPVDLDGLCAQVADELEAPARANDVELRWHTRDTEIFEVATDRAKVKTILRNLVGNAVKFTPGGRVEITMSLDGEALQIEVRDNGIGIDPEDLGRIFDMFRQVGSSPSRGAGGVGLGLHISKRLAERLGGSISVHSRKGDGSAFRVRLPVQLVPRATMRLAQGHSGAPRR
jgi:signal transduction histidine kinase